VGRVAAVAAGLAVAPVPLPMVYAQETHVLVVTGLGGEPRYREAFHSWAVTLLDAARDGAGVPPEHLLYLGERVDQDPDRIRERSTRENVAGAFREVASASSPGDHVLVLLLGHGTEARGEYRFNLPGPDLSAEEYGELLDLLPGRRVTFVNAASSSGGFIPALSAPDRVVITATRTGSERNETIFGRFFTEAFAGDEADLDRDGRVSVLEAFTYARLRVEEHYRREGRIRTETALLDDDGDGVGTADPETGVTSGDGALARTLFLGPGRGRVPLVAEEGPLPDDPLLRKLVEARREIQRRLDDLRGRREGMGAEAYERELEALLVELALKDREIRAAGGEP